MNKKFLIPITIILWLIIIFPFCIYGYIKYQLYSLKNDTYTYLIKKYDKEKIQKVETQKLPKGGYAAYVTFKDEPEHTYEYFRVDGKIRQGSNFPYEEDTQKYHYLEYE
ncbi:DUF3139 domain-containing protein [Neobacillus sp. YIM B06451]|uniref:DUF3139 domain-containing protein n=1 Tax=Neobacillus sp. YIM B06451 TaxID=3070994 RepID=UPI00292D3287|nr:DUF3139 domain-containing protein [Neobacillus sp. YIM B06451]